MLNEAFYTLSTDSNIIKGFMFTSMFTDERKLHGWKGTSSVKMNISDPDLFPLRFTIFAAGNNLLWKIGLPVKLLLGCLFLEKKIRLCYELLLFY